MPSEAMETIRYSSPIFLWSVVIMKSLMTSQTLGRWVRVWTC